LRALKNSIGVSRIFVFDYENHGRDARATNRGAAFERFRTPGTALVSLEDRIRIPGSARV
jgi:hypothetical protein